MVGRHVRVDELAADTVVVRDDELAVASEDVKDNEGLEVETKAVWIVDGLSRNGTFRSVVNFGMIE